jgi:hypothetical protein
MPLWCVFGKPPDKLTHTIVVAGLIFILVMCVVDEFLPYYGLTPNSDGCGCVKIYFVAQGSYRSND